VPRGNTPQNAWWIGCTTKIVVALQKNAANVVGCEKANIGGVLYFHFENSGPATMPRGHGSGAAKKILNTHRRGRATAATTSQAAAKGRPNRGAVATQRYLEVRLPRFYGVYEQLAVRGYVAPPRWMRVGMRNILLLHVFVLRAPPDRRAAARARGRTRASSTCSRSAASRTHPAAHGAARTRSRAGMMLRYAYEAASWAQEREGGELHLDLRGHDRGAHGGRSASSA